MAIDRERLRHDLDELDPSLREIARRLHAAPETAFEEKESAHLLVESLRAAGTAQQVETPFGGVATAFRARAGQGETRVAILAEYDALPKLGHACGHNLIAAGALGAFLALARQGPSLPGTVEILGTPGEEAGGGKLRLLAAGAFEGLAAAMMFHPGDRDLLAQPALASSYVELAFEGITAHPSIAPWQGKSALTACLDAMRLIDGQRIHFPGGASVHGRVLEGGRWTSVIEDHAACAFAVRARTLPQLAAVQAVVERCGRAAALAGDLTVRIAARSGYQPLRVNLPLARRFGEHFRTQGRPPPQECDDDLGAGSTDMGDVSQAVPSIHPWVAICERGTANIHSRAFAECAASEPAASAMVLAARAMAFTAADLLEDAALRGEVRRHFDASRG